MTGNYYDKRYPNSPEIAHKMWEMDAQELETLIKTKEELETKLSADGWFEEIEVKIMKIELEQTLKDIKKLRKQLEI